MHTLHDRSADALRRRGLAWLARLAAGPKCGSCGDALLDLLGQTQQTQCVGDLWSRSANALCQFLLGDSEIFDQLLVGGSFFQSVQLGTVNVLEQCVAQHVDVLGVADNRRHLVEPHGL